MKNILFIGILAMGFATLNSCKKKEPGICYCHYLSGDKTEYNLQSLTRSQQIDSCYVLDSHAEAFAGDCDLK